MLKGVAAAGSLIGSAGLVSAQLSNAAGAVVNGTYYLMQSAPFGCTFTTGKVTCGSGSYTIVLKINGVAVGGTSVTVTGAASLTCSGSRTVVAGDAVTLEVTGSTGNPPNAAVQFSFTRNSV